MASKAKIAKACKAMKTLGYSGKTVRPVVKELLELYENNWMLIEEDSYRVLVEAILDREEQKSQINESEHLNAWSEDEAEENEPPLKRSKLSSQKNQSSPLLHAFRPNSSNELENQPSYKQMKDQSTCEKHQDKDVEIEAPYTSNYCHGKRKTSSSPSLVVEEQAKGTKLISDRETDESNSLVPLAHLGNNGDESDSCCDFLGKRMITYERENCTFFCKETGNLHDDDLAFKENVFDKHLCEASAESEPLSYDLPGFEVPHAVVPPDPPRLLLEGCSHANYPSAKANCSIFPEVIDLDAEVLSPCLPQKDAYSGERSSGLEGNHSEFVNYTQSEEQRYENVTRDSLKLDVASSSGGEVKISLMVKSALRSDFHVPSLESVLKQVEEQFLKSYMIPQTDFSMLRLMNEVCEHFLVAGTTSTYTEDVNPANVVSSLGISEDPDSEDGPAKGIDHQLSLCSKSTIMNDSVRIQNLFEVSPQIPRFFGSVHLDLSRCRISLTVDVNVSSKKERSIMELNNCTPSSSRMMIAQKQHCYHYIEDITKGQEAYGISLINEINEDRYPTFNYISENVTYQNAHVRFFLGSISEENCCPNCFGDCLSLEIPCNCAGKTGGEFAYTSGGLVKEKFLDNLISLKHAAQRRNLFYCEDCPLERSNGKNSSGKCRGHIVRNFIKECWYKCGCSMKCSNRVVQQGIKAKLQVFMTPEPKGWGLRTLEDLPKGAFICEYVGEVITRRELFERNMQSTVYRHVFPVLLDAGWSSRVLKDEEALCLDAAVYGNVARFINHRCFDANLVQIPVEIETPDHHYYHLAFFTTREVNALEELTWDYGIDFNDYQPAKAFHCYSGSKFCRDHKSI
ncbi:Histone-lysine N-methyltransferase SUVR4 [Sesamum angolense]|uniref:Histone-lysine N-methyltransferase SUVR4 n=1 Tax=Sesamum angolense TaxID=2727404 RepID=A0AAE1X625_9LAMI|nr:Histone-lysine N-methyltransferase SUVR4 [Sesamum angolense]